MRLFTQLGDMRQQKLIDMGSGFSGGAGWRASIALLVL